ncbi:MAG: hypothetical protein R2882_01275 [Gemmatimonadales bacterium]
MSLRSSSRALLTLAAGIAALTSACSSNAVAPVADPAADLDAQMAANKVIMADAQARSTAVFDSLTRVWKNRTREGMLNSTSDTFVACAPQPYDGEAKIVGPAGGVFYFGPHKLTVPSGALAGPVAMAVIVQTDLKTHVTLLPHGTQFAVPVKLTLAYEHCEESQTHRVAYIDLLGNVLEYPTSADHPWNQTVDTWLNHFSEYAIAY